MSNNDMMQENSIKQDTFYEVPNFHKVPESMASEFREVAKDNPDVLNKEKFCFCLNEENGNIDKAFVFFIHKGDVFVKKLNGIEIILLKNKSSALTSILNMMRRSVTCEEVQ